MSDPARSMDCLNRLHDMGVRIVIDDFGTGYSSLSYLRRLPVDELKIDRSFIASLLTGTDDVIVRSTIDLAHNLGLRVVAEGVETDDVQARLTALGCDAAQGTFIRAPASAAELRAWIAGGRLTLYFSTGSILDACGSARRRGKPASTRRRCSYYERRGLLPKPPRRGSGYREYPADAVRIVRFIKKAQELGFSLDEIEELVRLRGVRRGRAASRPRDCRAEDRGHRSEDRAPAVDARRAGSARRVVPPGRRRGLPDHRRAQRARRSGSRSGARSRLRHDRRPGARRGAGRSRRHDVLLLLEGLRREVHGRSEEVSVGHARADAARRRPRC